MSRTHRLLPIVLPFTAALLPCQVWTEVGDAGELIATAQVPAGASNLTQVQGTLGTDDVDVYLIQIFDTTTFQAQTVGGPLFDSVLYLFDQEGRGVVMNDDNPAGGVQSRITGQFVIAPGRYYLAVTKNGRIPVDLHASPIWPFVPPSVENTPLGFAKEFELASWMGTSLSAGGAYTIALTGAAFAPNQVLLPGNHHLGEAANQTPGSTNFFSSTLSGHFQVIYGGTYFQNAGVTGPVTLTRLQMRAEDGAQNPGGQVYQNVTVRVGATSLDANTMSTTFALNLNALTTTLGPSVVISAKTIKRALGLCPNNYVVDIDLQAIGASFVFNPLSNRPNVIMDVSWTSAGPGPTGTNTVPLQDVTYPLGPPVLFGLAVSWPNSTSPTGTFLNPPIVNFEFLGSGGDDTLIPARVESIGGACGGSASGVYQVFPHPQRFDLANGSITLTPNTYLAPTHYIVTAGTTPPDLTKVNPVPNSITENAIVTHVLPNPFAFPGGSTSTIRVSDNGVVYVDNATVGTEHLPTLSKWLGTLGEGARLAPFWSDFSCGRNTTTHPNSGLHVRTDASGVCYCTWLNVGRATTAATPGGQSVNTMQAVVNPSNGVVEFRYGNMSEIWGGSLGGSVTGITGFTRGRIGLVSSVDPGSRDLSRELPYTTGLEGANGRLRLTSSNVVPPVPLHMPGRMFGGQSITWNVSNIPPGTTIGVQLVDIDHHRPGLFVPGITAPGCMLSTGLNPVFWEVFLLPGASVTGTVPFFVPPGFDGTDIYSQFVTVDLFGGPNLVPAMSNTLRQTVGRQ